MAFSFLGSDGPDLIGRLFNEASVMKRREEKRREEKRRDEKRRE
jgi:hypothetical protein